MSGTKPNFSKPLINDPSQVTPSVPSKALGPLEQLVGTWTNKNIHGTEKGGIENPYSYNLIALPQVDLSSPEGYILKNFAYYEAITFSAVHGTPANRGGKGAQIGNVLFYEQRAYFAERPAKNNLIHAENGSWLLLSGAEQLLGPYGDGDGSDVGTKVVAGGKAPKQKYNIIKQVSVPHGNSILAPGTFSIENGCPIIDPPPVVLPIGVNTDKCKQESIGNFNLKFTKNPNSPLNEALDVKKPTSYIRFDFDSQSNKHPIINIDFEEERAKVTRFYTTFWLEAFDGSSEYTQLQYTQTILIDIPVEGKGIVSFPHITSNTLTKEKNL